MIQCPVCESSAGPRHAGVVRLAAGPLFLPIKGKEFDQIGSEMNTEVKRVTVIKTPPGI